MEQLAPLFARQPIFDRALKVIAYELLFRGGLDGLTESKGDVATSQVLLYAFGRHRIDDITGQLPAYINFTRHWVMFPPQLPPEMVVVEVLEDVPPDESVLTGLKQLRERGHRIALDDFFITQDSQALLKYADVIKVDVLALPPDELERYVDYLRPLGLKLLAEKIETHAMFERCQLLGFDYFQGYFLSKPHIIEGYQVDETRRQLLQQLAQLLAPEVNKDAILNTLRQLPAAKALHAAGQSDTAETGGLQGLESLYSPAELQAWCVLLLMAEATNKPTALLADTLIRAKFCHRVSQRLGGRAAAEVGLLAGILSALDAFLDLPMDFLVANLDISAEMKKALLEHSGDAGCALDLILQLETANWDSLVHSPWCHSQQLSELDLAEDYREALTWSQAVMTGLFS